MVIFNKTNHNKVVIIHKMILILVSKNLHGINKILWNNNKNLRIQIHKILKNHK